MAELDDMRRGGCPSAFIVDDNFIGDKKKRKALLAKSRMEEPKLPLPYDRILARPGRGSRADGHDVGRISQRLHRDRDPARRVAPRNQEIPKYSGRGDSLRARQNPNAGSTSAGFIVGFDSDDKRIFDDQFRFIQAGITLAMVGMLKPSPPRRYIKGCPPKAALTWPTKVRSEPM